MAYDILLSPEAIEDLRNLKAHLRSKIKALLLQHLQHQPTHVSKSRIKRLQKLRQPQYRLRIDPIRVFYDVRGMTVEVLAIVDKSDAARWLTRFGIPEEELDDETDSSV